MASCLLDPSDRESVVCSSSGRANGTASSGPLSSALNSPPDTAHLFSSWEVSDRTSRPQMSLKSPPRRLATRPPTSDRRPDDRAIDQLLDVLHHRIAAIADGARERSERGGSERNRVRARRRQPGAAGSSASLHGAGHLDRIVRQRDRAIRSVRDEAPECRPPRDLRTARNPRPPANWRAASRSGSRSTLAAPRSIRSSSPRSISNSTRSSISGRTTRRRNDAPPLWLATGSTRPRSIAEWSQPSGPSKSTRSRAARWRCKTSRASFFDALPHAAAHRSEVPIQTRSSRLRSFSAQASDPQRPAEVAVGLRIARFERLEASDAEPDGDRRDAAGWKLFAEKERRRDDRSESGPRSDERRHVGARRREEAREVLHSISAARGSSRFRGSGSAGTTPAIDLGRVEPVASHNGGASFRAARVVRPLIECASSSRSTAASSRWESNRGAASASTSIRCATRASSRRPRISRCSKVTRRPAFRASYERCESRGPRCRTTGARCPAP